jgi:hypothetical protein
MLEARQRNLGSERPVRRSKPAPASSLRASLIEAGLRR